MQILEDYINIHSQIKQLEKKMNEIKLNVAVLVEQQNGYVKVGEFYFTVQTKQTFSYSKEVSALELQLKNRKKLEEIKGIAKVKGFSTYPVLKKEEKKEVSNAPIAVRAFEIEEDFPY
ncbi:MAG: hypothetical protein HQK76_20055 [Desulfobacterales bacterium]|nr:hypothetical protein [Desulfobacterales bacterium]